MIYIYDNILSFRVIDGNTVMLDLDIGFLYRYKYPFRLYGINAPESKDTLAAQWLRDNLKPDNLIVEIHKPDKYGRWLATLYTKSGVNINNKLIELGFAVEYVV